MLEKQVLLLLKVKTAFQTLFAPDMWRAETVLETRQLQFGEVWRALASFGEFHEQ